MQQADRDEAGRFLPGQSGNPKGVSREVLIVKRAAQKHGTEMIQALVDIVRDGTAPHAARVAAARRDRGFGKPEQNVDVRMQLQKLEILLDAQTATMSDADLRQLADRWDEMQGKVIDVEPSVDATCSQHEENN